MSLSINPYRLTVHEMRLDDIFHIADYWLNSDPDFLIAMGVDLAKLPKRSDLKEMLRTQVNLPYEQKQSLALVWNCDGEPIGHCNVNEIIYGKEATVHLHLWQSTNRQKGIGSYLLKLSIPVFFEKLDLKTLWCEPFALNPSPNKTLLKVGFEFVKRYKTIPGSLNFEQEVNRYRLERADLEK